jgi:hypothetical protein
MRLAMLSAVILTLAGCALGERPAADPLRRNIGWYAIAGGEDLRAGCTAGAPARYRFVYNAVWEEQVRLYEVTASAPGPASMATLRSTVIRGAPRILQSYVFGGGSDSAEARLEPEAFRALAGALDAAGFARPPVDGLRLQSFDFYWLVTACIDGVWALNAWKRDDPGFANLGFDRLLFAADATGVPVNPPRRVDPAQRLLDYGESPSERGRARASAFELVVRGGRLWGAPRFL